MEMNEQHEATLKALLSIDVKKELPEPVVRFYSRLKKMADKVDILINEQVLLLIASVSQPLPEAAPLAEKTELIPKVAQEEKPVETPPTPEEVGVPCVVVIDGESKQAIYLEEQPEKDKSRVRLIGEAEVLIVNESNVKLTE